MRRLFFTALLSAAAVLSAPVRAQTLAEQEFNKSWNRNQVTVKINYDMPPICDDFIYRAAATWNAQGAAFTLVTGTSLDYFYTDRIYGVGGTQVRSRESAVINVEPVTFASDDPAIMKGPSYTYPTTNAFAEIYDADVQVREEYLYYAEKTTGDGLICTTSTSIPSTKYDFETVFLHELGHNVGFRHRDRPTTCVMYEYGLRGRVVRKPCWDEAEAYRQIYGRR